MAETPDGKKSVSVMVIVVLFLEVTITNILTQIFEFPNLCIALSGRTIFHLYNHFSCANGNGPEKKYVLNEVLM